MRASIARIEGRGPRTGRRVRAPKSFNAVSVPMLGRPRALEQRLAHAASISGLILVPGGIFEELFDKTTKK